MLNTSTQLLIQSHPSHLPQCYIHLIWRFFYNYNPQTYLPNLYKIEGLTNNIETCIYSSPGPSPETPPPYLKSRLNGVSLIKDQIMLQYFVKLKSKGILIKDGDLD